VLYIAGLPGHRHNRRSFLLAAALATAGCDSGMRPDINDSGISNICQIAQCTPDTNPGAVCQHTCTADPGPRLVNCAAAEQSYEFGPVLWTFEEPSTPGFARSMYSYTDNSTAIKTFRVVDSSTQRLVAQTWQPPTAVLPRCSDQPNDANRAIHIQGGPFLAWGGGVGIGMKNHPEVMGGLTTMADVQAQAMEDVSAWEGVSFWARRGPDSQVGFRVLVGDKSTDDDIAYLMYRIDPMMPRYCQRVRECGCLNHRSCVAIHLDKDADDMPTNPVIPEACKPDPRHLRDTEVMKFCGTPEVISGAESAGFSTCNTCGQTKCDERWPAYPDDHATSDGLEDAATGSLYGTDRQFYGKPCSPYTLRNGIFGYWCFDPEMGERPAETTEQCGDHWTRVVNLSNEWQFYTVPFNTMAQQGWAQRSAALDLKSVSVVRFTWDGGWVDFWIDDVRFYRTKTVQ
jgi:hypothetical protein